MRSRVMPGSSPTIALRDPTRRLKSVDLPTLGRPTIAMRGESCIQSKSHRPRGEGRPRPSGRALLDSCLTRKRSSYYRDSVPSASQLATSATSSSFPSLHQFFAPGGVLSQKHPAYEFRRGQLQMAQAVERSLEERRHLIVEAGTGTGKTLAYLVPVIRSGKRVILSTG